MSSYSVDPGTAVWTKTSVCW